MARDLLVKLKTGPATRADMALVHHKVQDSGAVVVQQPVGGGYDYCPSPDGTFTVHVRDEAGLESVRLALQNGERCACEVLSEAPV